MFATEVPRDLVEKLLEGNLSYDDSLLSEYLFGAAVSEPSQVRGCADFRSLNPALIKELRTGDRWVHKDDPSIWFPDYRSAENYLLLDMQEFDRIIADFNRAAVIGNSVPLVLSFFSGGTLSMIRGPDGIFRPAKDGTDLLEFAGHGLTNSAEVGFVKTPQVDSADMKVMLTSEIVAAYHYIVRNLNPEARRLFAGVVIGHGTDTAAATGATVQVMHTAHDTSVGLVCAQRAADRPLPDGPSNISSTILSLMEMHRLGASHLFCHSGEGVAGELLVLGGYSKFSDRLLKIFGTRGYPIIARLGENELEEGLYGGVGNRRADSNRPPVMLDGFNPVNFFSLHQNDDPAALIQNIMQTDMPFHVVTSFGAGTVPRDIIRALMFCDVALEQKSIRTGKPREYIFVNTLFTDADLRHSYESNIALKDSGIYVLCATEDMINAKAMMARALSPDSQMQKRIILTPMNRDYPPGYASYSSKQYSDALLTGDEKQDLFHYFEHFQPNEK